MMLQATFVHMQICQFKGWLIALPMGIIKHTHLLLQSAKPSTAALLSSTPRGEQTGRCGELQVSAAALIFPLRQHGTTATQSGVELCVVHTQWQPVSWPPRQYHGDWGNSCLYYRDRWKAGKTGFSRTLWLKYFVLLFVSMVGGTYTAGANLQTERDAFWATPFPPPLKWVWSVKKGLFWKAAILTPASSSRGFKLLFNNFCIPRRHIQNLW